MIALMLGNTRAVKRSPIAIAPGCHLCCSSSSSSNSSSEHHARAACPNQQQMYKRDVCVVLVSFFALFLCLQHEGNFSFRKAWYHVTLQESEQLEVLQDRLEDLPPPLVADLNGDGHLEVILATHDYKLQLVRPEPAGRAGEGFAPVQVATSFSLLPQKVLLGRDRRPVAMAVGFLDPEPAEKVRPARKQVLVVVTAAWQVLAFDHNLALLWEVSVEEALPRNARLAEVAVAITPHQVRQGSRGLVVVGGSLELGDVAAAATGQANLGDAQQQQQQQAGAGGAAGGATGGGGEAALLDSVLKEELRFEAEEAAKAHGGAGMTGRAPLPGAGGADSAAPGMRGGVDVSRHFSYYAFEGGKGEPVWRHDSGAFHKDLDADADELRPQDDFRLHADALAGRHFGEMSCREFRESVLAVLPQQWSRPSDSRMEEALFVKHREGAGQQKAQLAKLAAAKAASGGRASHSSLHPRKQQSAAFMFHLFGSSRTAATTTASAAKVSHRPGLVASKQAGSGGTGTHAGMAHRHAHLAHNSSANALVAHVQDGVEAVHLYSGRTLCKLHLPPNMLHADINGDGVIDHIAIGSGGSGAAGPLGVAGSVHHHMLGPCQAQATSGIPPRHVLWVADVCHLHRGVGGLLGEGGEPQGQQQEQREPVFAPPVFLPVPRADGSYSHLRGQHGLVITLSDDGWAGALTARGERLWQVWIGAAWESDGDGAATPTLTPLSLRPHSVPTAVLAVGQQAGVVLSEHGNVLAEFHVAFPPVAPAVVADFDGDGLNDVIIVTRGGVFGYAQVQHLGGLSFGALLLTLIMAMGIVYYGQAHDFGGAALSAAAGMPGMVSVLPGGLGGGGAARARKLRSTEYVD